MTSLNVSTEQVIERREGRLPFVHSVRARTPLTMRYWDYLAWAVERARPRRLLVLGLGGGTVLQLLELRGVTPPCVAIDLDPQLTSLLRDSGWLTYPQLTVIHEDARMFLTREAPTELFDVIVVDVYDEQGYVQELYESSLLARMVSHLAPDGVVLVHCLDPMAKFPSFRVVMPELPRSPSCAIAERLAALGLTIAVFPHWSSMLIAGSRTSLSLGGSRQNDSAGKFEDGSRTALAWSDCFWAGRELSLADLKRFLAPLEDEYSYANLEHLDGRYLMALVMGASKPVRAMLQQSLALPALPDSPASAIVRELVAGQECELTPATMQVAMTLKALLERTTPGGPEGESFVEAIALAARSASNPALAHAASFALAWNGHFARALAVLHEGARR